MNSLHSRFSYVWMSFFVLIFSPAGLAIPDSPVSSGSVLALQTQNSVAFGALTAFPASSESFTVEGYIYINRPSDYNFVLFAKEGFCKIAGTQIWNGLFFESGIFFGVAAGSPVEYGGPAFPLQPADFQKWHHYAMVHDAQQGTRIYWDGALVVFNTVISTASLGLPQGLSANAFITGQELFLDEIRVSKGIRYSNSFTPPINPFAADAQTVALWHFDGANEITLFEDSSGLGNKLNGSNGATIARTETTGVDEWWMIQ